MGYRCKYFAIQELVYPALFEARGDACWDMLDPRLLITLDEMRAAYGEIRVNDWHHGGPYKLSGARPFDDAVGAKWSMHKYLRAADCKFLSFSPEDVASDILSHPDKFPHLTCMEDAAKTRTWLHIDTRNHNHDSQIWVVQP